jgi:hypothetical protein
METKPAQTTQSSSANNDDLLKKLMEETEFKEPGKNSGSIPADFWEKKDKEVKEEKKEPEKPAEKPAAETTATATTTTQAEPEKPAKKITKEMKEASANTAIGMLELSQKIILVPVINGKYKKKFKPDEIHRLNDGVEDADKERLTGEDLELRNKWDRLMKKRDKQINGIPFKEDEKRDLREAFMNYFDFKEKTLGPEWFLGMAIVNTTGRRVVDIVFD